MFAFVVKIWNCLFRKPKVLAVDPNPYNRRYTIDNYENGGLDDILHQATRKDSKYECEELYGIDPGLDKLLDESVNDTKGIVASLDSIDLELAEILSELDDESVDVCLTDEIISEECVCISQPSSNCRLIQPNMMYRNYRRNRRRRFKRR